MTQPSRRYGCTLTLALIAVLLPACGGGGGDAKPPPGPSPRLGVAASQMIAEVGLWDSAATRSIELTIQDAPPEGVYLSGTYSNIGIESANFSTQDATASLVVHFRTPLSLGPGTYNDTITLRACMESPCENHIAGSPKSVGVKYVVKDIPGGSGVPSVTYSTKAITVTGDNLQSRASFNDTSVKVSVTNPPAGGLWYRATTTGKVVLNAAASWPDWPNVSQGHLELTIRPPSTLGAGTHPDQFQIEFCADPQCNWIVPDSQATIYVDYEVTGSANPTVTVDWSQTAITGAQLVTTETRAPQLTLTLDPSEDVHDGVFGRHSESATGLITHVVETSVAHGSQLDSHRGRYEIFLKPPATLGSGVFTDTMQFRACFDPACVNPVPDSEYEVRVEVVVLASEGTDFTRQTVSAAGTRDVVWSEANQLLYVSTTWSNEHRLVEVDPVTATTLPGPALDAQDLHRLAVTPDGSYLYAGSSSQPFVLRFALPSLAPDLSVFLGDSGLSTPYAVTDLQTLATQPRSFVVAVNSRSSNAGVYVFDDATARPESVQPLPSQTFEQERWLVPGPTPDTFYSQLHGQSFPPVNNFELLTAGAGGINKSSSTPTGYETFYSRPARAGERMFTNNGAVLDAATGEVVGQVEGLGTTLAYAVAADEDRNRLYVWWSQDNGKLLLVHDLATLEQVAIVPVYDGPNRPGGHANKRIATWGDNGLALVDGTQLILLSGPALAE